ncbi:MAG: YdcH family protein [Paracoccaceae bacterium]
MSLDQHVHELRRKHEALSRRIETELRHPGSDDLAIAELKRRKLHLKDEIARLSH